jgi:hypothetical protein
MRDGPWRNVGYRILLDNKNKMRLASLFIIAREIARFSVRGIIND